MMTSKNGRIGVLLSALTATLLLSAPSGATVTTRTVSEANNGQLTTVSVGQVVRVLLHSTYWSVATPPASVLRAIGTPVVTASSSASSGCVTGAGCGTLRVSFRAVAPGQVRLRASRSSCGEALRCTPAESSWSVVVRVR